MIIPIRCFTCNKPIAGKWKKYNELKKQHQNGKVLDMLGMKRECCRRMFISQVDLIDNILKYPN